jgi:hypothetical protein
MEPKCKIYPPRDKTPYERCEETEIESTTTSDGNYVFVQALDGIVYLAPDRSHQHPKVLGGAVSVMYAGECYISKRIVVQLTNLSGTFMPDEQEGLLRVAQQLIVQGLKFQVDSVRFYDQERTNSPTILW